jgi:hypothetical protein
MYIANKCKILRHNPHRDPIVVAALLMEPKDHAWEVQNRESGEWPPSPSGGSWREIYAVTVDPAP